MTAAFAGLLDDAAVFPPGNAPVPAAVREHRRHQQAWYAELVGPFVFPAAGVGSDFAEVLDDQPLEVSLTVRRSAVEGPLRKAAGVAAVRVQALEIVPDGDVKDLVAMLDSELPPDVLGYVEVPRGPGLADALDALAGTRYRAKFRTGGTEPAAHPSEAELAGSLLAAVTRNVTFKCTAGLHHAVRHTDGDLEQHGFLNVLIATAGAQDGAGAADLQPILTQRHQDSLARTFTALGADRIARARESFVSFGTCSIADPVADLVALGLVEQR
jgi:hypothetical protein